MRSVLSRKSPVRLALLALAFGMLLVACGGGDTAVETAPDVVTQVTPSPATDNEPESSTVPPTDQTVAGSATVEPEEPQEPEPVELDRLNGPFSDSEFPDAVVEDLAGGKVNVKYLGAEDKPVLLWFWAPH